MRSADVIILGGGLIGLSLAFELRKSGASILVLEKGEPGREASHAAAGMLAPRGEDLAGPLAELAQTSARIYPEFVQEIEDASGTRVDLRRQGTILVDGSEATRGRLLSESEQQRLEPCLSPRANAMFLEEQSVDPRALVAACLKAAHHHGVGIATGEEAKAVTQYQNLLLVETPRARYSAGKVVNCCGAWAGAVEPVKLPVRPVKGQMFSVVTSAKNTLRHVVHGEDVYIVPRSNGRMLIGATIEEAGFDKRVEPQTIQRLHQAAADLVPSLGEARMLEAWAGLRPASADDLPVLGATPLENYFIATAHFRNGILLAPITARLMAQIIAGKQPESNLAAFSPNRFLH